MNGMRIDKELNDSYGDISVAKGYGPVKDPEIQCLIPKTQGRRK